ncbi:alpha/beta hydrolase [Erythrobacter alti]|uniref:alpha/beta hydrolase n=1 Tax=Erythrobacter alti TaxID=1896145 RepID=UPI0030F40343
MITRAVKLLAIFCAATLAGGCAHTVAPESAISATRADELQSPAQRVEWTAIAAPGLPDQRITIWLPPGYHDAPDVRYPVLYMWDGQNLFDPELTHYGKAWEVDDVLTDMVASGTARSHIVVGHWSPPGTDRYRLYVPQFAESLDGELLAANVEEMAGGPIASRALLDWVSDTLKPHVDAQFRTLAAPEDTTVVGASMGGLMACFAAIERPDVFGRAGCVSAHFALVDPELAMNHSEAITAAWDAYLDAKLGGPRERRLWLDHGTEMLDAYYAPWQRAVSEDLTRNGWREGVDFSARVYRGAEHDEIAWNARMAEMLAWLWREEE